MLRGFSPNYDLAFQNKIIARMTPDKFADYIIENAGRFPFEHGVIMTTHEVQAERTWRRFKRSASLCCRLPWLLIKRWMQWP